MAVSSSVYRRWARFGALVTVIIAGSLLAPALAVAATPSAPALTDVWVSETGKVSISWTASTDPGDSLTYYVYRLRQPITAANTPASATPIVSTTTTSAEVSADSAEISEAYVWYYAVRAKDQNGLFSAISKTMAPNLHGYRTSSTAVTCTRCHSVHGATTDPWDYTEVGLCYSCHASSATSSPETDIGDRSTFNIKAEFKEYGSQEAAGSWHRSTKMETDDTECDACHSAHRSPYYYDNNGNYVAGSSYRKMLRVQTGVDGAGAATYTYYSYNDDTLNPGGGGESTAFCFACHGAGATPIGYVGDDGAYAETAGDHNSGGYATAAHGIAGTTSVKSNDFTKTGAYPAAQFPQVQCLACHDKHASASDKLIGYRGQDTTSTTTSGTFAQADLCFQCHSDAGATREKGAGTSVGGTNLAWNGKDVGAEFRKASHHPYSTAGGSYVGTPHSAWSDTTQAEFSTGYTLTNTKVTNTAGGEITLDTYTGSTDPGPEPWIFANRGSSTTFDGFDLASQVWNDGFNPDNHAGANGNTNFSPASGSSSFWVNNKAYTTRGGSTAMDVFDPVGAGTDSGAGGDWDTSQTLPFTIGAGGDTTVNSGTGHNWVYFTRAGGQSAIAWWDYTGTSIGTFNFRWNNASINLGLGSAIAYAPDCDRLFVLSKNNGAGDGYLYYRSHPDNDTNDENFNQATDVDGTYTTGYANRMTYFKRNGAEYLMIVGRDNSGRFTRVIGNIGETPTEIIRFTSPFGTNSLADGADLEWDGGDYIYAVCGGAVQGFRRIRIPDDPSASTNWNIGTSVWSAELPNPAWDTTNGTWALYSSIAIGAYDPPAYSTTIYRTSGTAVSPQITPYAGDDHWGIVSWSEDDSLAGTNLTVTAEGLNGSSSWVPLAGPADDSSIDLSAYSVADYSRVRLTATLTTSAATQLNTPKLYDWAVTSSAATWVVSGSLTCANCHNVHSVGTGGAAAWNMARVSDPANTKNPASTTTTRNTPTTTFCLTCHDDSSDPSSPTTVTATINATTLIPYTPGFRVFDTASSPFFPDWNKNATNVTFAASGHGGSTIKAFNQGDAGQMGCQSCHDPHASQNARLTALSASGGSANGHLSVTRNNTTTYSEQNLCYACHDNSHGGTCNSTGCHNTSMDFMDVYTPFQNTSAPASAHPVGLAAKHSDTEGGVTGFGEGNRHAECVDCHDPHTARNGLHTGSTAVATTDSKAGNALVGAWGVQPTYGTPSWPTTGWSAMNWTTAVSYSPIRISGQSTDFEAYLCLKCHSGYSGQPFGVITSSGSYTSTDVAVDFNPSNFSVHNVFGQSTGMKTSFTYNGTTVTWVRPADSTFLDTTTTDGDAAWTADSMMTCTDCHSNTNTADARGPHGSSIAWLLDPAYVNWSATSSLVNNAAAGTSGMNPSNIICAKCHLNIDSVNWVHSNHDNWPDGGGNRCQNCHVKVPHGWKRPRLLGSDLSSGITAVQMKTITNLTSSWSESNCRASCYSGHSGSNPTPAYP
ncbi:MAG: cytochrome c3 family protein [Coriobacteriia bacterium]